MVFPDWLTCNWPKTLLKVFGSLHLVYGAQASYYLAIGVLLSVTSGFFDKPVDPTYPYEKEAYITRMCVNVIFLIVLFIAGFLLLRVRRQGVLLSNVLFIAMIVYLFDPFSALLGEDFRRSMSVTAGIGCVPLGWMLLTGYPIICLVVLNLAQRRLPKTDGQVIGSESPMNQKAD
jgi:hypothetical protein